MKTVTDVKVKTTDLKFYCNTKKYITVTPKIP